MSSQLALSKFCLLDSNWTPGVVKVWFLVAIATPEVIFPLVTLGIGIAEIFHILSLKNPDIVNYRAWYLVSVFTMSCERTLGHWEASLSLDSHWDKSSLNKMIFGGAEGQGWGLTCLLRGMWWDWAVSRQHHKDSPPAQALLLSPAS